jgi:branched-subunit amino acid aminotransferase/4-amino-4-deoxychorismate lyase
VASASGDVEGTTMKGVVADRAAYRSGAAFVDGRFVPVAEARVPILDWGFLRSDATYDVAHVWRGSFFRLEDYLDRFERGMERLHMSLPHDRAEIRDVLMECVRLSGLREAYAEMICTRGVPPPGSRDPRECENNFFAFAVPFVWNNASWHISHEVREWIDAHNRAVKRSGEGVRIISCLLPKKSPWRTSMEPEWVHGKRRVVEADGLFTAHALAE